MRTRILVFACTLVAFLPLGVWAQSVKALASVPVLAAAMAEGEEETDAEEGETAGSETEGAEVVDQPGTVQTGRSPGPAGRDAAPGEVHTVVKGDTLWGLSQQYLGNSWYWPKVWSYNPEIVNPHWIYPGNPVRFFPAGPDAPTQVEAGTPVVLPPVDEGGPTEPLADEEPPVEVTGPIAYQPRGRAMKIRYPGFVTDREIEEAGKITGSFSEAVMLSFLDDVYVAFKQRQNVRVGERYLVFRTESEVKHPVSGKRYGYLTRLLGTMRVVGLSDNLVTAQIQDAWDSIERGDLVGPSGESVIEMVSERPNERELKGYVLTSATDTNTITGEHHVIVIDKGSADGVSQGNTFVVVRRGNLGGNFRNPALHQDNRYPQEDIAACMAVDVKKEATTCLLIRSLREVVPGDQVEMRLGTRQPVSLR